MYNQETKNRLKLLHAALKYCSDNTKTFEIGERIMINQERASLLKKLDQNIQNKLLDLKVSEQIETKINSIRSKITLNIQMPYLFEEYEA